MEAREPGARPADTREAILRAARPLFARQGFDGTSIRDITRLAGANLGAVTYHFGTKKRLYLDVLSVLADPMAARLAAAGAGGGAPLDRIEAIVRGLFAHLSQNRDLPALMLHELALNRPVSPPVRRTIERIFDLLTGLIRAGQEDGSIAAGSPILLAMSAVAQPIYMNLVRQRLREAVGVDPADPDIRAEVADHIVRFIRRSLSASGTES